MEGAEQAWPSGLTRSLPALQGTQLRTDRLVKVEKKRFSPGVPTAVKLSVRSQDHKDAGQYV